MLWLKNYASIGHLPMVINHEGRVSVVVRMYILVDKIPASILYVSCEFWCPCNSRLGV